MKKFALLVATALFVVACSYQHSSHKQHSHHKHHQKGYDAHHHNPELTKAMKACHSADNMKNMADFEQCLAEKGFKKPANHPTAKPHKKYHHNPKLSQAMKECHQRLNNSDSTQVMAQFEACLKEKGFEKPANHPTLNQY